MQTASLGLSKGAPFQANRGRTAVRRPLAVRAAAVDYDDTDLGAMFRQALTTPVKPEAPVAPAPAAPPPPPPVPEVAAPPAASITVDPVPGTEILSSVPKMEPPRAATQGMDFVLDKMQSKPPGFGDDSGAAAAAKEAAAAAKEAAKPLADSLPNVSDSLASAGKGLGDASAAATSALGDAGAAATSALGDAGAAATSALGNAGAAATGALGGAGAAASKGLTSAAGSVGAALGGVTDVASDAQAAAGEVATQAAAAAAAAAEAARSALTGALGGASGAAADVAGGAVGATQQFLDGAAAEFNTELSIIKSNFDSLAAGVNAAVSDTTSAVSSQVSSQVGGVVDQVAGLLPPEAREVLGAAGSVVAGVASKAAGLDPTVAAVLASAGVALPALAIYNAKYGGYAGLLQPEEAFEMLQSEDALLLDIRPEAQRVQRGVAELRRGALGKGAAVPPVRLLPSVQRRVRDYSGLCLEIQALEVAALSKVSAGSTKVLVMDGQGESAKTLARALRAVGIRRAYVVDGGYRAWEAAGLAVRKDSSEYDATALDAVSDVAETVAEAAASKLSTLREPVNAAVAVAALAGLGYLGTNYHSVLQFAGVLGLELTLVSRALTYSSLQDALDDVVALSKSGASLATLPAKVAQALQGRGGSAGGQQAVEAGGQQAAGKGEA